MIMRIIRRMRTKFFTFLCKGSAQKVGKDKAVELIDELAECDLRFDQYPICNALYEKLHDKICELLTK